MTFPCTKCGLCCKKLDEVSQLDAYHAGDGVCFYYAENIGCNIYESRPDVCRVDDGYERFFSAVITKQDYYHKNAQICNKMQKDKGLDRKYRVVL